MAQNNPQRQRKNVFLKVGGSASLSLAYELAVNTKWQ